MIIPVFQKISPRPPFIGVLSCSTFVFFSIFFILVSGFAHTACAETNAPSFDRTVSTLAVGKHATVSIKNLPGQSRVSFSSSNPKMASVSQRTDKISAKLSAKKCGNVTISAQIYRKNGTKIRTLKMKIRILPKDYIENARFSLKQTINSYSFTLRLKASRIILKKEIKKSKLTLTPEGKKAPRLSADFSKLSPDGKEIVYLLDSASRKKLCPHDCSMDGAYMIFSNSFSQKIRAHYKERLDTENISGFVLDACGTPLSGAFVSYQTTEGAAASYTDKTGHYEVKKKGAPISLTVKKKGYQTETLYSLTLSKKGTICENIILKSKTTADASLDLLVKTEDGTPVPNAQVLLLPKGKISSKKLSSITQDHFLPEDTLISEKTGTDGTLLLASSKNQKSKAYPNTRLTSAAPASLSLLSSYTSAATRSATLPVTYAENEEYTLYVYKNTPKNSPSYESCKLTFSPSSFYTNHLHFEILLKKCDTLDTSMLSISLESLKIANELKALSFSLFEPGQKKAVYENSFTIANERNTNPEMTLGHHVIKENTQLFSISRIPVSLSSGIYFLRISGLDENGESLYSSAVTEIQVKDNCISPVTIKLFQKSYSRLFAYYSGDKLPELKISFDLYQKAGENYFYFDTVSSSAFKENLPDLYTADLFLSCLLPQETYLFLPGEALFRPASFLILDISSEDLHPTENAALTAPPFSKCACTYTKYGQIEMPPDFSEDSVHIFTGTDIHLTREQIRTEPSYPNSVIALYKKDGTLISTTLSPKLDRNTVLKESSDTIIDIYTNHELLLTNQSSYQ